MCYISQYFFKDEKKGKILKPQELIRQIIENWTWQRFSDNNNNNNNNNNNIDFKVMF